jgi:hypothetical protein
MFNVETKTQILFIKEVNSVASNIGLMGAGTKP